jgi:GDP-L-fucose synthase
MIEKFILDSFNGKNILVTGGTGLIGRQVVTMLCDAGAHVEVISLDKVRIDERASYFYGDLTDFNTCKMVTKGKDFVFHIAGIKGSVEVTKSKPSSFFVPLLMMNTNILEACRINNVEKVVYTSSVGAYSSAEVFKEDENLDGPPMDMFPGWAKRMAEKQIEAYKIQYGMTNFSIVRPANIYGPGDNFDPNNAMVIPSLMMKIHRGDSPVKIWGDGSAIRDFAYSEDVAHGIIQALYYGTDGTYINLGSGKGVTIRDLVETLQRFIPFTYSFDMVKSHNGFPKRVMDISLAQKKIHYDPSTSLREGLEKTWDWFNNNPNEYLNKQNYFSE